MMRIIFIVLALCITASHSLRAQDVPGCMDPLATNYMASATVNNGTCTYNAASGSLTKKADLSATLTEISGMIHINGKLYALNDGGNAHAIYVMDSTSGAILQTITLAGTTNVDWEDLTTDGTYIYVGDFGNNVDGNRTDLKFYRVPLQSIFNITEAIGTVSGADIEAINFSYEDQTDFSPTGNNNTDFDCEAVIYHNGQLHLFTKNWIGNTTSHYVIPAEPGDYVAQKLESFDTGGILITSATKANDNIVIILGYKYVLAELYPCALWIVSGFTEMNKLFSTGNKRKIDLGSAGIIGQIESITAVKPTWVLISNENRDPVSPRLYSLSTEQWTAQYVLPFGIANFTSRLNNNQVVLTWEYSEQGIAYFEVEAAGKANGTYQSIGKVYNINNASQFFSYTDQEPLVTAQRFYRIKIVSPDGKYSYSKTLAVSDSSNTQFNLAVAPNPFNDKLDISFYSDKRQTVQFCIMDMHGRTIMLKQLECTPGRYSYMMDGLQGLSNGVYFLTARTPGNSYVRKIVR
ncbi:T9SS type A sorting domain-containing protein [Agriterribacter sp.]|uniref:T9SS type A sorting domain-containing protein n=1 Tax=Agriterribacter sp. TaxID=2821509 RepID=UPI002BFDB04D|nr:T9SS type A sorting domain-containing protein [Agriterribacter sp.]HTN07209.1 T9SS type A sorting domain-containing protein [Agriterribacter sp.]